MKNGDITTPDKKKKIGKCIDPKKKRKKVLVIWCQF